MSGRSRGPAAVEENNADSVELRDEIELPKDVQKTLRRVGEYRHDVVPIAAIRAFNALDIMMSDGYHQRMRTTLTLDDDVAAKLKAETRRSGRSFKDVVNEYLRLGLYAKKTERPRRPFRIEARDLGALRPGLSLDNVGDLLEQLEGPVHR